MARILAEDPSKNLSIAGFLIIDSPYHIARSKLTMKTTKSKLDGILLWSKSPSKTAT